MPVSICQKLAVRFLRVDGPPSCPAFDDAQLTLATGGDDFSVCRTISAGTSGAYLSIFDADGVRRCGPTGTFSERTVTCNLPAGPLTVIFHATEAAAMFELSRQA